ncbi:MAG TPA: VIT1/CCC1 transporter family protein [Thermohalobaculum sp.]|nr:VIT1/CCC1 transporter family protein [Thermohalobaculum sp.]
MASEGMRKGLHGTVRRYLPEIVYGANDGVVTTLAVIASVVGADLPASIILILGFANLFADGVSMAASDVLSERSRPDAPLTLRRAARHGVATFVGFLAAGFVPLTAYLAPGIGVDARFWLAVALAGATLFGVGAGRAFFADRGFLRAGIEMLLIGAGAGGIAYGIGSLGSMIAGPVA